jgi:hypothetical protein
LTQPELEIIRIKYQGLQFGKMSDRNLRAYAKATLLKIHVITGWSIPKDELMNLLLDQFIKKLLESYPNVNTEEIEYAFRNYGTTVKDWGKNMSLALIDEVMIPYLANRKHLSHEIEERMAPPPAKILTDEDLDNLHRAWTEEFYQHITSGIERDIPDYTRSILVKDGLIKDGGEADLFFMRKLEAGVKNIYLKIQ